MAQLQSLIRRRRVLLPETEEFDPRRLVPPVQGEVIEMPRRSLMPIEQLASPEAQAVPLNVPARQPVIEQPPIAMPALRSRIIQPLPVDGQSAAVEPSAPVIEPVRRLTPLTPTFSPTGIKPEPPPSVSADLEMKGKPPSNQYGISRKKAILLGLLGGFGQGGLVGAATGALTGAISPETIGRQRQLQRDAETSQNEQRQLGLRGLRADVGLKEVELANAPGDARAKRMKEAGARALEIIRLQKHYKKGANPRLDALLASGEIELGDFDEKKGEKARPHVRGGDGSWYYLNDDGRPAERVEGVPGERLVEWKSPSGKTYRITEAQAASNDAATVARQEGYQRADSVRQEGYQRSDSDQNYTDTITAQDRRAKNEALRADSERLESEAADLERSAIELESPAAVATPGGYDTETAKEYRWQAGEYRKQAKAKRDEATRLKRQIMPDITPRSAAPTRSSSVQPASEAAIRAAAEAKGLDPNVAVKRARQKGLIP